MTATFTESAIPADPVPAIEPPEGEPFDPQYPDSTPDAPYGYKPDGTPFKRHHGGRNGGQKGSGKGSKTSASAAQAASLLARMNALMGVGFIMAGMPESAATLAANNDMFESMARESLANDPQLCRKILSVGATSGKAGLVMAYVMLGANVVPTMRNEYRTNNPKALEDETYDYPNP